MFLVSKICLVFSLDLGWEYIRKAPLTRVDFYPV